MKLSTILPITIGSTRINDCFAGGASHILSPPAYEDLCALPAYDDTTSDEDDHDYLQPPSSRSHTPPPCYSDIFDSDDSEEEEERSHRSESAVCEEDIVTTL